MHKKLAGIQWLRAVAALLVVVDHCVFTLVDKANMDRSNIEFAAFIGTFGVQIFFVISGFVMIESCIGSFGKPDSILPFLQRRLIRIVPLYWITTAIYSVKSVVTDQALPATDVFKSLLFWPFINSEGHLQPVYGLGWSLNYEMYFYIILAACFLFPLRAALALLTTLMLGTVIAGSAMDKPNGEGVALPFFFWSRPIVIYFLMGALVVPALSMFRKSAPNFRVSGWILISLFIAIILTILASNRLGLSGFAVELPACTALVTIAALYTPNASGYFYRTGLTLGDASYSLYLTHAFLIGPLARLFSVLHLTDPWLFIPASLPICIISAIACHYKIERPLISKLNKSWLSR